MRSTPAAVAVLTLLVGLVLTLFPATAQAVEDTVKDLSVNYDIQPDGSVVVRYEIDWRFGSEGRHGIDFGIATRERWDADPTQDVTYDVSDITVTSPSGAPDSFTQTENQHGSVGSLDLRIGDPVQTVDGLDATYVISYELRGALRTFDGTPEFYWDVTGEDYPAIEQFTVTITAPEGVQKARCLLGDAECGAEVTSEGSALLTGSDIPSGTVISAVAALVPGAVADAEPTLERRLIEAPIVTGITSVVEVTGEGMTHVEQELTYLLPADAKEHRPVMRWSLPLRRPFSRNKDQVFRISNLSVEGAADFEQRPLTARDKSSAHQDMQLLFRPEIRGDTSTLTLSYDVEGAVATDGDTSHARWALAPFGLNDADTIDFTWKFPADVDGVACTTMPEYLDEPRECVPQPALESFGNTVSWHREGTGPVAPADAWVGSDLPATSVGHAGPILERGIAAIARRDKAIGVGGGLTALAGTAGMLVLLSRIRVGSDQRWADVPPGLRAPTGSPVRRARRGDIVPVRFEEPDCSLAVAGLVLDGRPSPRHLASVLVHMAVLGAVNVQSKPLKVIKISPKPLTDDLEKKVYKAATLGDTTLDHTGLQQMGTVIDEHQKKLLDDRLMFAPSGRRMHVPLHRNPVLWGLAACVVAFPLAWIFVPGWLGSYGFFVVVGAMAGCVWGLHLASGQKTPRSLEPNGTAMRDQVQGFRQYIATAEANQLDFEADQDIYRRYLPWAVLFGVTERWTKVCQELTDAGRIPSLDTSFWVGAESAAAIAGHLSSFQQPLRSATPSPTPSASSSSGFFSGGGSGGSSGFSGGSSGGGGGGGTSASSW